MIYTEEQLQRFSNPPAKYQTDQIIRTHEKMRQCIEEGIDKDALKKQFNIHGCEIDIYLQGSYKNSTNISNSSDVDLNVEFKSVYYYDTSSLPPEQVIKRAVDMGTNTFDFDVFKSLIYLVLKDKFGDNLVKRDDKCIRFIGKDNNPDSDIVPCCTFRKYSQYISSSNYQAIEGIKFKADSGTWIENYPKIHYDNLIQKSQFTNNGFKQTVRLYKTLKEKLIEQNLLSKEDVKSYYIENLLYNLPNPTFSGTTTDVFNATLDKVVTDFNQNVISRYKCANGVDGLFDNNQWDMGKCRKLLIGLTKIRDNNAF